MDTITHLQPLLNHTFKGHPGLLNNPFVRQQHVSTRAWNMVNFSDQKSVDIKLGTAEGDKITLSLNTILEESYSSYNSRGYMDGIVTQSQMKAFSRLSGRELSITVEGDLNDEELSDIKNVLEKIENLAGDFFAGEMDEAVQQAIQFDDMGSVIALQANLEHTYAMSAEQQYMTKITGTASGLPEAATVKEKPVNGDWVTALIDAMTQAVSESKVKPEKMTRVLPKFIDQLFEKHVIKDDPDRLKQDLVERIKPGFLQTLSEKGISDKLTDHDNGAELEASGGEISDENRDVQRECENEDVGEWENVKENEDVHINK